MHAVRKGRGAAGLVLLALLAACTRGGAAPALRIAAAADLQQAFEEIGREFQQAQGEKVTFVFGASGILASQLAQGAPYDAFFAADASFVDRAIAAGACEASSKGFLARGRLSVWSRDTGEPSAAPSSLADLASPRFRKIAIAHPEHAPNGRAAKEALVRSGVWEAVQPRVVYGETVIQALQYAVTGNADVAIVAHSVILNTSGGRSFVVDESLHSPIDQTFAICTRGANTAGGRRFAAFAGSERAREILRRHGFTPPETNTAQ